MASVKFCGLTRPEDARLAAELGATHVGVILASGPRLLTAPRAREVLSAAPRHVRRVGVFGGQAPDEIASLAGEIGLDVVQLHSARTPGELDDLRQRTGAELWAVVRVTGADLPEELGALADAADAVVIDSLVAGALGGTGVRVDWPALAGALGALRRPARLVLAGGLRADNVAEALAIVRPDVVDVSSGVETSPGIKNPALMRAFAQSVISTQSQT